MNKINLIVIGVSLVFLSGCANLGKVPKVTAQKCPITLRKNGKKRGIAALPKQSLLIPVLQDYMDLLDKLKTANQGE